jgi:hypothetical protein
MGSDPLSLGSRLGLPGKDGNPLRRHAAAPQHQSGDQM